MLYELEVDRFRLCQRWGKQRSGVVIFYMLLHAWFFVYDSLSMDMVLSQYCGECRKDSWTSGIHNHKYIYIDFHLDFEKG